MVRIITSILLVVSCPTIAYGSCTIDLAGQSVFVKNQAYPRDAPLVGTILNGRAMNFIYEGSWVGEGLIDLAGTNSWYIPTSSTYTYDTSSMNVLSDVLMKDLNLGHSQPFVNSSVISYTSLSRNAVAAAANSGFMAGTLIGNTGNGYSLTGLRGTPNRIVVPDQKWCDNVATLGRNFTWSVQSYGDLVIRHHDGDTRRLVGSRVTKNAIVTFPVSVSTSPLSLSFGRLNANTTGTQDLTVAVRASSSANHTIAFTYTSDSGTRESLTVDGNSLPYTASRTIGSGQVSRSEVFKIRITSSTAMEVKGRLQITARLT